MKRAAARAPELKREYERLLGLVLALCVLGAIWVYSASSSEQILKNGSNGTTFLFRYALFAALGFLVLAVASRGGVAVIRKLTYPVLIASIVLCMMVVLPGIGVRVNGANRWLGAGAITFQPSELAKFALIAFLALRMSTRTTPMRKLGDLRIELAVIMILVALVAGVQRDIGTTIVIVGAAVCVLIMGGMPGRFFLPIGAVGAFGLTVMVAMHPYRIARLASFLAPGSDSAGTGYQALQGQLAIGTGGLTGSGLGNSVQKADWLPEAHTDFILAVVGEELGAIGIIMLLVLYGLIAYTGLKIADKTEGQYQKLLAVGITAVIIVQAMLNVWVVLGIFPLTGVPLPFISYGGTSLAVLLGAVGVLLNIARGSTVYAPAPGMLGAEPADDPRPPRPRGRAPRPAPKKRAPAARPRRQPNVRPAPSLGLASARVEARRMPSARGSARDAEDVRDRSGWDRGARGAGAGGRRRAS
ncbi:putative lipid II flippase FtsW [Patulibacter minatonensis]|uniref:putative lipid II flippase FtsW n=1 Tax=Patulibacter minatonensis TaxID=298163 RepID=UPI0004AF0F79|nr:putative lipid II flippase FtsW [Patulibacter minatonensis]